MPAPASYARESDGKDTLKTVNFNVLILFFKGKSDFFLYLCRGSFAECEINGKIIKSLK